MRLKRWYFIFPVLRCFCRITRTGGERREERWQQHSIAEWIIMYTACGGPRAGLFCATTSFPPRNVVMGSDHYLSQERGCARGGVVVTPGKHLHTTIEKIYRLRLDGCASFTTRQIFIVVVAAGYVVYLRIFVRKGRETKICCKYAKNWVCIS